MLLASLCSNSNSSLLLSVIFFILIINEIPKKLKTRSKTCFKSLRMNVGRLIIRRISSWETDFKRTSNITKTEDRRCNLWRWRFVWKWRWETSPKRNKSWRIWSYGPLTRRLRIRVIRGRILKWSKTNHNAQTCICMKRIMRIDHWWWETEIVRTWKTKTLSGQIKSWVRSHAQTCSWNYH